MSRLRFEDLVGLYRNTQFGDEKAEDGVSELTVATQAIVDLLARVESDEDAAGDTGISLIDDIDKAVVGARVRIRVDAPRTGLGILARSMEGLLNSPGARVKEPSRYYLVDPQFSPGDENVPDEVARYRKAVALVGLFANAASFLDSTRGELVFVKNGRIVVPIRYGAADLASLATGDADRLLGQFADDLHKDQKLEILFEALVELCRAQPTDARFEYALRNLGHLADAVRDGYKLFASSFSYSKIRGELEGARIEYTQKIHKTIVDIQNQLLGIPVATVVVASQMKAPTACGPELWVNFAVILGAWIFVGLLVIAIVNQWLTLNVIKDEIGRQKKSLLANYPAVTEEFVGTFESLDSRIWWHHSGLVVIAAISVAGAIVATGFHNRIASMPPQPCATASAGGKAGIGAPPTPTPPAIPAGVR